MFRKNLTKNIKVLSSKNIRLTRVEKYKVILEDVSANASLCVSLQAQNFYQNEDKSFGLSIGPYHRKFLDGYYPYHLSLIIKYHPKLEYTGSMPKQQTNFIIVQKANTLNLDAVFEGKLKAEFQFNLQQ